MSVVIESAVVGDAAAIADVHISSLRAAYQGILSDRDVRLVLDPPNLALRARSWQGWLERTQASTLVARVDGAVVGFCALHPMPDEAEKRVTGEIPALYLLSLHWRRGIGRLLCEQTLAAARTRGFAEVVLWVLESNERARRFYDALGFRPDGERRTFSEGADGSLHELRYRRSTSDGDP